MNSSLLLHKLTGYTYCALTLPLGRFFGSGEPPFSCASEGCSRSSEWLTLAHLLSMALPLHALEPWELRLPFAAEQAQCLVATPHSTALPSLA
jgi:hypothetical protein